jgi:hypothetical protein
MDEYLFRPFETLRRLEDLDRRARHAERLLRAALWEVERVQRGESTLEELRTLLQETDPAAADRA